MAERQPNQMTPRELAYHMASEMGRIAGLIERGPRSRLTDADAQLLVDAALEFKQLADEKAGCEAAKKNPEEA